MKLRTPVIIIAAAGIAGGIAAVAVPRLTAAAADYRDATQLARAVQGAERAKGIDAAYASCARVSAGDYACAVGSAGGAVGSYRVTVSPDGRSWKFS